MQYDDTHFRLLRLAIYRALTIEQLSETLFLVTSSRPNHPPYTVDVHKGCPCDAVVYCSHLAIALDRWMQREASDEMRRDYFSARRLDFGSLCVRPGLCGDERRFLRRAVARAEAKYSHLFVPVERAEVRR